MRKPTKWPVRPAKTQISLDIHPVGSVFPEYMKKPWVLSYPLIAQQKLWSDWVDAQVDLPNRRFIAQSLSCSPFHRLEMTEILKNVKP